MATYHSENLIPLPAKEQDEKTIAERKWTAPVIAPKPQKPLDIGLFSDDSKQQELKL